MEWRAFEERGKVGGRRTAPKQHVRSPHKQRQQQTTDRDEIFGENALLAAVAEDGALVRHKLTQCLCVQNRGERI